MSGEPTVSATSPSGALAVCSPGLRRPLPARVADRASRRRSAGSPASSSTRSRPWSGATGSRSRARAGDYPRDAVGCSGGAGSSSSGRTRRACSRSSLAALSRAMTAAAATGTGSDAKTHPAPRRRGPAEIRERGPLRSRHFEGAAGGGMWNWKPAKAMLERLWNHGELVIAGRQGFQRVYDLAERVIPRAGARGTGAFYGRGAASSRPYRRCARGAPLTEAGIKEHWRLRGGVGRIRPAPSTSLSPTDASDGCGSTTAAQTCLSPATPSSTCRRRARRCCSRRSTTCSGTAPSRATTLHISHWPRP